MAQLVVRKLEPKVVVELRKRAALLPPRGTKSLKELLLLMPAVGADADFARPKGRPRRVRL